MTLRDDDERRLRRLRHIIPQTAAEAYELYEAIMLVGYDSASIATEVGLNATDGEIWQWIEDGEDAALESDDLLLIRGWLLHCESELFEYVSSCIFDARDDARRDAEDEHDRLEALAEEAAEAAEEEKREDRHAD
jgi:hypothetical protein